MGTQLERPGVRTGSWWRARRAEAPPGSAASPATRRPAGSGSPGRSQLGADATTERNTPRRRRARRVPSPRDWETRCPGETPRSRRRSGLTRHGDHGRHVGGRRASRARGAEWSRPSGASAGSAVKPAASRHRGAVVGVAASSRSTRSPGATAPGRRRICSSNAASTACVHARSQPQPATTPTVRRAPRSRLKSRRHAPGDGCLRPRYATGLLERSGAFGHALARDRFLHCVVVWRPAHMYRHSVTMYQGAPESLHKSALARADKRAAGALPKEQP